MKKDLTEIAYILDRSGSMSSMTDAAISGFNHFLSDQIEAPGQANLTLVLFDDEILTPHTSTPISQIPLLDPTTFVPRGSTALLDAIGTTIITLGETLANRPEAERPETVIIAIFTDGYENASTLFTHSRIAKMIRHQETKYSWEILFLAAHQDAIATASSIGIKSQNSAAIQYSKVGVRTSASSLSRKTSALRDKSSRHEAAHKDMTQIVTEESAKFQTTD
ncbi:MAG: vWA domain-containing protein [Verrucomicrobiaceae bacterium]